MPIKSFIQSGFVPLSNELSLKDATAKLSEGTYGVVLKGHKPVGIATQQKLRQIAKTGTISLLHAAKELPTIVLAGLNMSDFSVEEHERRIPTVVIAMPRLEVELFEKAQVVDAVDIVTRGGLVLDESGRAGLMHFKDIAEYLSQRWNKPAYRSLFNTLASSGLIGEPIPVDALGGVVENVPLMLVTCDEPNCEYPNELAEVPECNEMPKRCQNPEPPVHDLKIPGC
jgi:hypothetical protein